MTLRNLLLLQNEILMERRTLCERLSATKGTHHPFIVQMHAAFDDYEHIYYCMDLHVTCGDLWSQLKHGTDKKMVGCHRSQAKHWLYQLVDALEHMHEHGIVHRDLKPENILLDSRNHVVVIDFGTAKDLVYTNLNGPEFVGTPDFMSPEAVKVSCILLDPVDVQDLQGRYSGKANSHVVGT